MGTLAVVAVVTAGPQRKRFLIGDVIHAVLDPIFGSGGNKLTVHEVACKLPHETEGSRQQKIDACVDSCVTNATVYLGSQDESMSPEACPVACKYAYEHPTPLTCD